MLQFNQYQGGPTLRLLPRVVQQLKFLPRVDKKFYFYALEHTCDLIIKALERTNEKKCDLDRNFKMRP